MSHIKWDEETIAEHDKLRGTRRKIIEANTPFIVYDQEGDTAVEKAKLVDGATPISASDLSALKRAEKATSGPPPGRKTESSRRQQPLSPANSPGGGYSLDPNELSSRLQAAADGAARKQSPEESYQDGPVRRKQSDRKDFLAKRKNHYNEFQMAKMLAAQLMDEEDDDDDDDAVGESGGSRK
jgi:hypothetical protein